jgi:hypothetical protein
VPAQNPITRIESVARQLGRLAEELGEYPYPDARTVLLHWQHELIEALADVQRVTAPYARV